MARGKQVVSEMHLHASQLMELYGEQYILIETDHEHGITIRFRMLPRRQLKVGGMLMLDTTRWDWRLGGRTTWIETSTGGGEEGEMSNIKWQVIVEKL